jgi:hypothetical protein
LTEFFLRLLAHSTRCFSARDVLSFLGRKWPGKFEGEVVTDHDEYPLRGRLPGCRVKHRMKRNWLKMYDKAGWILRVETVINDPEEFRVRRRVRRRGRRRPEWVPRRKSGAYLFRYRDVSLQSNARYLNALAQVEDPTSGLRGLEAITTRKRSTKAFNPVARPDGQLFTALMSGEYAVHGFANRDLRSKRAATAIRLRGDPTRQSAQVSRLLHRLHVYASWRRSRVRGAGGSPTSAIGS